MSAGVPSKRPRASSEPLGVNTYAVAIGVVLIAGVAFARVSFSAQTTRCGYRLDTLREHHLELAEENRRLKMEQGKRQSVVRMLNAVDPDGGDFVRYDEAKVVMVRAEVIVKPRARDDVASGVVAYVADLASAARPERSPVRRIIPETVAVADLSGGVGR